MTRTIALIKQRTLERTGGFITEDLLPEILEADRLCPVLVRHSHGRLVCTAQEVKTTIKMIESYPGGYLRDIQFTFASDRGSR